MANSTTPKPRRKPKKPRPDFPLYAHASGKWSKTILGKAFYFGSWSDPEAQLPSTVAILAILAKY